MFQIFCVLADNFSFVLSTFHFSSSVGSCFRFSERWQTTSSFSTLLSTSTSTVFAGGGSHIATGFVLDSAHIFSQIFLFYGHNQGERDCLKLLLLLISLLALQCRDSASLCFPLQPVLRPVQGEAGAEWGNLRLKLFGTWWNMQPDGTWWYLLGPGGFVVWPSVCCKGNITILGPQSDDWCWHFWTI